MLESICEEALYWDLRLRGLTFEQQKEIDVIYKEGVVKSQKLNVLIAGGAVVEMNAMAKLPEVSAAGALSYSKATGLKHALLTGSGDFLCEL